MAQWAIREQPTIQKKKSRKYTGELTKVGSKYEQNSARLI